LTEVIPERRKKRATVEITLAVAVFLDQRGRTVLLPPPHKTGTHATHEDVVPLISNMWHFPTIVVRENGAAELKRFLARFGALPTSKTKPALEPLAPSRHTVTYRAIKLLAYRLRVPRLPRIAGTKSVTLGELVSRSSVAVSNLTRKIAQAALDGPVSTAKQRSRTAHSHSSG
jgi:hypothetical protein